MNDLILSSEGYELLKTALDNYKHHDRLWFTEDYQNQTYKTEWAQSVFALAAAVDVTLKEHAYILPILPEAI